MKHNQHNSRRMHTWLLILISAVVSNVTFADTHSAVLSDVSKGSIIGGADSLARVDGNVSVVLPNSKGDVSVVFAFNIDEVSNTENATIVVDVFEQSVSDYTLSISTTKRNRFTKFTPPLSCNQLDLCTSIKATYELPGSLANYIRGNQVLLKVTTRRQKNARLVIDALTLEQSDDDVVVTPSPLASQDDQAVTNQGESVSIPVLDNDTSGSGNAGITISSISDTSNGTTSISGRNIIFTPNSAFFGEQTFQYTAFDSFGFSDTASVKVIVIQDTNDNDNPDTPVIQAFSPGSTMYWQLQGSIATNYSVDVYGIDLEDNESNGLIQTIQSQGKKVVCYISAGSYEDWRSDKNEFDLPSDIGNPLGDWPGEYYLDIRSDNVRRIMRSRIDRAVVAGCDALEPDNTDAYQASNGLGLTAQDQVDYLLFLANYAHSKGLSIGLKNTVDLISSAGLADVFDWTLNESCYVYNECDRLKPFIAADKAVYIAMYGNQSMTSRCADAASNNFNLSFYGSDYALDGRVYSTCP